ncbi:HD domain-containing protein [Bacillaceae bacterium Marseille-Q3522]|nr:HD domain-containing protein [Bacillaceae bacterium Marseille-Q3522]
MRVKVKNLEEGSILAESIYKATNWPIINKNTVLTNLHISVLKAFFIKDVEIDDSRYSASSRKETEKEDEIEIIFHEHFSNMVNRFKREFQCWQAGLPVDIAKARNILIPFLQNPKFNNCNLFSLHLLSVKTEFLYQHSVAVGLLCGSIAKKLHYSNGDIVQAALAGLLADCGMARINPSILKKTTILINEEITEIKKHPIHSLDLLKNTALLRDETKLAIYQHHERLDGSGYPAAADNSKLHRFAKIIAVADTYHAMTSERFYNEKQHPYKVLEMLLHDYFGKFDLKVIKALANCIITYSIGSIVQLSNGETGKIIFINEKAPTRPLIKKANGDIMNLETQRGLYIEKEIKHIKI